MNTFHKIPMFIYFFSLMYKNSVKISVDVSLTFLGRKTSRVPRTSQTEHFCPNKGEQKRGYIRRGLVEVTGGYMKKYRGLVERYIPPVNCWVPSTSNVKHVDQGTQHGGPVIN